jgi:hypothetical protein
MEIAKIAEIARIGDYLAGMWRKIRRRIIG